jgi:hypothetical protein
MAHFFFDNLFDHFGSGQLRFTSGPALPATGSILGSFIEWAKGPAAQIMPDLLSVHYRFSGIPHRLMTLWEGVLWFLISFFSTLILLTCDLGPPVGLPAVNPHTS